MLPLSRPRRQALMTLAMVVLTGLPTAYVALLAWRINRPGHARDVEVEIGRSLGLRVTLDGVRYPRPGEVLYQGVVLRQDEPLAGGLVEIARARSLRLRRDGSTGLILEADGLSIRAAGPREAMEEAGGLLGGAGAGAYRRVSLTAPGVLVDLGGGTNESLAYRLRNVAAEFRSDPRTPGLSASYWLVDPRGSTRCELSLSRDRRGEAAETTITFKTMEGGPLPARVLEPFFASADWLGKSARVQGGLTLRQAGSSPWRAEFSGDLVDVDLKTLFERRFPRHRMTGLAHLAIRSARWDDRPAQGFGWASAEGELSAGAGSIGYDLLAALKSQMNFRPSPGRGFDPKRTDIAFGALGFTFALTTDGEIVVGGGFKGQHAPEDILLANDRPLFQSPAGVANVRGLVKALYPATAETLAPVTADSQLISRFLPLPREIARADRRLGGN